MDALSLTQDLCARLCHDLGGPLGALASALDLVESCPNEALPVARDGAEVLRRRLRLWRAAAGGGTGPLGRDGVAELLEGTLAGGRADAELSGLSEAALSAPAVQAVLAAAMLGGEALPRGGVVHVAGNGTGLAVWPEGRNAAWPPALTAALAGETVRGPRDVLAPLLLLLAEAAGLRVALAMGSGNAIAPMTLQPR
jgi:histidine phosphotransferase ChpT